MAATTSRDAVPSGFRRRLDADGEAVLPTKAECDTAPPLSPTLPCACACVMLVVGVPLLPLPCQLNDNVVLPTDALVDFVSPGCTVYVFQAGDVISLGDVGVGVGLGAGIGAGATAGSASVPDADLTAKVGERVQPEVRHGFAGGKGVACWSVGAVWGAAWRTC